MLSATVAWVSYFTLQAAGPEETATLEAKRGQARD
jgi:hypothetical protein